jgi:hypothetical protein
MIDINPQARKVMLRALAEREATPPGLRDPGSQYETTEYRANTEELTANVA